MKRLAKTLLALCAVAVAACATTRMTNVWRSPNYPGSSNLRILVMGVSPNPANVKLWEDAMAKKLKSLNRQPVTGYSVLPPGRMVDKAEIVELVKQNNIDLVLITRFVSQKTQVDYVPPTVTYVPPPTYYGYYPYYSYGYGVAYSPGYVTETSVIVLETNAYSAADESLVWSGVSQTFDYSSVSDIASSVASAVAESLVNTGIIR
jgi:hypothetical protein